MLSGHEAGRRDSCDHAQSGCHPRTVRPRAVAEQERYLQWFCQTFTPERPPSAASAINAMFRLWGHQFIYDEQMLADAMRSAGFKSVTQYPISHSDHPELQNLVNEQRYPEGLLNFESVTLEGIK